MAIWMRPELLMDVFWLFALLAMGFAVSVLIHANLRPSAAHWFTMLVCAGAVNILGVILTDLVDLNHPLGLRAISLGRAFIPFFTLGFSLVFPYRRRLARNRDSFLFLALPSLVTMVVTDPCFAPRDIAYQLWFHVPWMGGYFLWAYLNLFFSYRRTSLQSTRHQHLLLSVATIPSTATHFTTSILLPALGRDLLWRYNWVPILGSFAVFLVLALRYGILLRCATISRRLLDRSIDAAAFGSQMVSHAVKNSLQVIRALAEQACVEEPDLARLRCRRIITNCEELAERMNRLNLLTRVRADSFAEEFAVTEPLERALERVLLRFPSLEIHRDYLQPIPKVRGDRTHLEEVFLNLLVNAAESMPGGGIVRLEIKVENDLVVVAIHDRGKGIPSEQIPKIFEPFRTTKSPETNWGIGLSYCYLVVQKLGGDLFVESSPGKGSSFFLVLPPSVP